MTNFIKDSLAELEHVVWPTHLETKKFFAVVTGIIVAMTIFTYLVTLAFSNGLFEIRKLIHAPVTADLSGSPVTVDANGGTVEVQGADGTPITVNAETAPATPAPEAAPAE